MLGSLVAFFMLRPENKPTIISQQEQEEVAKQDAAKKEALADSQESTSEVNKSNSAQLSTYTPPSDSDKIVINASQDNDQVIVVTKLYGYSDGDCMLTINNNSHSKTISAPIMFNREYSTCNGFALPISTLGTGTWNVVLKVTSGGITTSQETSIGVQ